MPLELALYMGLQNAVRVGTVHGTSNAVRVGTGHGTSKCLQSWHCTLHQITVTTPRCEGSIYRKKKYPRDVSDAGYR